MSCPYPTLVQTLIFTKSLYTSADVYEWLRDKGFDPTRVEETSSSYRARQHDPDLFDRSSFRTITMGRGQSDVKAVIGCPSDSLWARVSGARAARKLEKARAKERGLPPPPPLRPSQPKLSPGWTAYASARQRTERRRRALERGLPQSSGIARRLLASPPSPGMSLREWAEREGIPLTAGDRAVWKQRRRS